MSTDLIARARAGDQGAFGELVAPYERELHVHCYRFLGSVQDAEDALQDTMFAAWRGLGEFEERSSIRTWLYRVAHNIAISFSVRTHRRGRREGSLPEEFDHPSPTVSAEEGLLREEKRRALVDAIRRLPATDRQIILLHFEGLSYGEIEDVSGLSESAIATRLTRIRAKLKEEIRRREVDKP